MFKTLKCCNLIKLLSTRKFSIQQNSIDMKYLNVAEKNEAAKTIAALLSKGSAQRREGYSVFNKIYDFEDTIKNKRCKMTMTSVSGHLLELEFLPSYRNWRNIDPQALFEAPVRKTCKEDYQPIKRTLEREIRSCNGLIIWTDCDREGENIGMEIIQVCRAIKPNIQVYRAVFSEITAIAVRRALQQLKELDKRASEAVDVRTELDLRTGAAITRFQTLRLQRMFPQNIADKLISYGSCQIPTLGFVAERYKEIEAFVSEPFWKIKVLHTINELTVEFLWARHRLFNKQECENYYLLCVADPKATVESVTVKPKSKWRPQPMDTVEMEKLASRKLKIPAKDTMNIAEKLYTKGLISYPRTETNQFSKEFDLRPLVDQQTSDRRWGQFAQRVMEWGPNPRNGNKSDQAHPPIHPTKYVSNLDGNEARVYELICRHFLACVSKDGFGMETVVNVNIAGEKFTATGLCIHERNYLDVYIYDKWNAKEIHRYEEGQIFEPTEISMPEGATTAPPLLTEADLIALMEKHGIGTDATHAEHINTIKERGYIGVIDKGFLVPGVIGMALYEGYNAIQLGLAKPILRAEFEADLKKICTGEKVPQTVLREQIVKYKEAYKHIMDNIRAMDEQIAQRFNETPAVNNNLEVNAERLQELFKCPKCGVAHLALRKKKNQSGHYIGCLNFPDCKNAIWLSEELKEPHVLEDHCVKCGNAVKLLKIKFQSALYKTQFNAPFGWYKTCLCCDAQFRDTFNIALDCVKKCGNVVAVESSVTRPVINTMFSTNNIILNNNPGTSVSATTHNSKRTNQTNSNTNREIKKLRVTTKGTKKTKNVPNLNTGIREFVTHSRNVIAVEEVDNMRNEVNVPEMDEFFHSNDSFDNEMLLAVDNISAATSHHPSYESAASGTVSVNNQCSIENIEEIFAQTFFDDDENDTLSNLNWGIRHFSESNNNIMHNSNVISNTDANSFANENIINELNRSWGTHSASNSRDVNIADNTWSLNNVDSNDNHNVKCSGCGKIAKKLVVRKEGVNKGRTFYSCSKERPCKYFQWADEIGSTAQVMQSSIINQAIASNSTESTQLQCRCGTNVRSLSVRKEGPNKGRQFFSCANGEKTCGFFQWADEPNDQASSSSRPITAANGWGSSETRSSSQSTIVNDTWGTSGRNDVAANNRDNKQLNKKRKCGLCRKEGHIRSKCPQSAQFNF